MPSPTAGGSHSEGGDPFGDFDGSARAFRESTADFLRAAQGSQEEILAEAEALAAKTPRRPTRGPEGAAGGRRRWWRRRRSCSDRSRH